MKKIFLLAASLAVLVSACNKDEDNSPYKDVTISMGANLVYDVFYSFETGEVANVVRSDWDLAFSTSLMTASIRINEGSGVEVFTAGAASDWDNLVISSDTAKLWNDKSNWNNGAFNRNSDPNNPFNFGWGTYSMDSHNVTSDSVYVIKLSDGHFKKFMVTLKDGTANTNSFKWADLNGDNEDSATIDMGQYSAKQFVYYSIVNKEVVDYEPDADKWDLLFTFYKEKVAMGPGVFMDYDVMGILTNQGYEVAKVTGIKPTNATSADSETGFVTDANAIGWDWKVSDHAGGYTIPDSLSYFIKTPSEKVYQIYFTKYGGQTTGEITFKQKSL